MKSAIEYIKSESDVRPLIGIVLGSGLDMFCNKLESKKTIPYNNIPNFSPVRNFNGVKFFNESDDFLNILNDTKFKYSNHKLNSLYYSSNYNLITKYIDD